jgi:hypothetical protein
MGYGNRSLNDWRDEALRIAKEHGFTDASIGEDFALIHSEVSEALEDYRNGRTVAEVWYEEKESPTVTDGSMNVTTVSIRTHALPYPTIFLLDGGDKLDLDHPYKPCGIPSELADVIIRILHFAGKHNIDIEQAVREKMHYNETRPFKHGGKKL